MVSFNTRAADFTSAKCWEAERQRPDAVGLFVAAAKAGTEEGVEQIGGSMIVAPSGEVVAESSTLGDELIAHDCDLDACRTYKEGVFPPSKRKVEHYGLLLKPGL